MKWVVGLKTNTMLMIVERKVKRGGGCIDRSTDGLNVRWWRESEGESVHLTVDVHSSPHLWPWADHSLRDRTMSSTIWEKLRVETLSSALKGGGSSGSGIWLGCLLCPSYARCFRHIQLGGGPGADPRPTGGTTSFSLAPSEELREESSLPLCLDLCSWIQKSGKKMSRRRDRCSS